MISREKQTNANFHDNNSRNNYSFSSEWAVNRTELRKTIKKFLKNTFKYRLIFRESRNFEKQISSTFSFNSSAFTEEKFFQSFLAFSKHVKKNNLAFDDIHLIWFNINNICRKSIENRLLRNQIMLKQSEFSRNVLWNLEVPSKQMQIFSNIFTVAVDIKITRLRNEFRQLLQTTIQIQTSTFLIHVNDSQNDFRLTNKSRIAEKIKFFYSTTVKSKSIINSRKHLFYRNLYAFVNSFKNFNTIREKKQTSFRYISMFTWYNYNLTFNRIFQYWKKIHRDMSFQN